MIHMKKSTLILGAVLTASSCVPKEAQTPEDDQKITAEQVKACRIEKKSIFPLCDIDSLKLEKDCGNQPLNVSGLGTLYSSCTAAVDRMDETCEGIDITEYRDEAMKLRRGIERKVVEITKEFNNICEGDRQEVIRREEINKTLMTEFGIPPIKTEKPKPSSISRFPNQVDVAE